MPSISITHKGSFSKAENRLRKMSGSAIFDSLSKYGELGVHVLASVTPMDTGETANSWYAKVEKSGRGWKLSWHNQNRTVNGDPIAIMIQTGHGTGTGGYVAGQDYINPAIKPVFNLIVADVRRKVAR
ncbi:hypothetical protein SEA_CONLEY_29 [Gordonia phage Conley]|nr:hypothetical protein SEA_CONLEY_29 [Gordonia phage Conley]